MDFAVVAIAGFQEKVSKGQKLRVPVLQGKKEGDTVNFDEVLLYSDGKNAVKVGTPHVKGAVVEAKVIGSGRAEKILVYKMKHRKRYRRTQGHRQNYMEIEVLKIKG
jgi:large subunit ribosomal protein L21